MSVGVFGGVRCPNLHHRPRKICPANPFMIPSLAPNSLLSGIAATGCLLLATPSADAGVILVYDSLLVASGGSSTELSRINSQTDNAFVASSGATSTVGSKGVMAAIHGSQTSVKGAFGDQNDMLYRFGSDGTTAGNGILGGPLTVGHAASGPRLDFSYTAAQAQTLTEFSFNLFNNSNNSTSYGARDTGLFVQIAGGGFFQFGDLFTSPTGNGPQGTVVFSDDFAVGNGDLVEFRLAFTDRTRTNNDLQATTRIGDVQISAVPEPSAALLGGLGLIALLRRRRA